MKQKPPTESVPAVNVREHVVTVLRKLRAEIAARPTDLVKAGTQGEPKRVSAATSGIDNAGLGRPTERKKEH